MKYAASALVLTAALGAGAARAADLPSRKAYIDAPPPAFTWSGVYAGLDVGGGLTASGADEGGVLGGGQLGYNHQIGPLFVVGLEADFQGTSLGGGRGPLGFVPLGRSSGLDWFGTARGRVGITPLDPHVLFYGTGGFAYGDDGRRNREGWTAGGGVEWAFAPRWSVKAEYLFTNLGKTGHSDLVTPRRSDAFHIIRVGVNYHVDLLAPSTGFFH
jgi:outer membrane immunogenic protein